MIVSLPPIHKIVPARVALEMVGGAETSITFCVAFNLPANATKPLPANDAASADDVPAPKVTFCHTPASVVLSDK